MKTIKLQPVWVVAEYKDGIVEGMGYQFNTGLTYNSLTYDNKWMVFTNTHEAEIHNWVDIVLSREDAEKRFIRLKEKRRHHTALRLSQVQIDRIGYKKHLRILEF